MGRRGWRLAVVAAGLAAMALGLSGQALGQERGAPHAAVIELDSIIHPVSERFLSRALNKAARDGAAVVILRLDTPGGLLDSTRAMVEKLFASPVSVAVYVAPSGSRAASAGTFITAAANFAAMAPGTNIGAASPISGSGQDIPDTLGSKIFQDTAAFMRSIAERRGRNVVALEATVLEAVSYSAEEAVETEVVDLIAKDLSDLLEQLDGRTTTVPTEAGSETVTMRTRGLATRNIGMGIFDTILSFIADPNIAFLLLSLGGFAIVIELLSFGLIVPGVFGGYRAGAGFYGAGQPAGELGGGRAHPAGIRPRSPGGERGWLRCAGHRGVDKLRPGRHSALLSFRDAVAHGAEHWSEPLGASAVGGRSHGVRWRFRTHGGTIPPRSSPRPAPADWGCGQEHNGFGARGHRVGPRRAVERAGPG